MGPNPRRATLASLHLCAMCHDGTREGYEYPCRYCGQDRPAVLTHKEAYKLMLRNGADENGRYTDPVSGKLLPAGRPMLEHANRKQRRSLEAWRRARRTTSLETNIAHQRGEMGDLPARSKLTNG